MSFNARVTLSDQSEWWYHPTKWLHGGVRGLVGAQWACYPPDAEGSTAPAEYGPLPFRLDGQPLTASDHRWIATVLERFAPQEVRHPDTDRLDWLEATGTAVNPPIRVIRNAPITGTLREMIDAARLPARTTSPTPMFALVEERAQELGL